jgi:PQQ-dependent dehydrogenase (s-GDH family)
MMKHSILFFLLPLLLSVNYDLKAQSKVLQPDADFEIRIVADKLSDPWSVSYGPDNYLWATEAKGYRVLRINPATGERQVLLDLNKNRNFPRYDKIPDAQDGGKPWPQGGLMGLALHPMLLMGKPYVYLAYIHHFQGADSPGDGKQGKAEYPFQLRIVRYQYDKTAGSLSQPEILCDTVPASNDHNGGRLLIAPVHGKDYLFYSIGDMGAGQFLNGDRINRAQNTASYEGKILRFSLEPDTNRTTGDRWVPADNPFNSQRPNAVWSVGHRNPQGLAYAKINGKEFLYATEHGAFSDDEVNIIEKGKNYGHPLVMGYADGNYDGLAAGVSDNPAFPGKWHTSYPLIKSEKENARKLGTAYRDPVKSFFPASSTELSALFNKVLNKEEAGWESFAPSGVTVYQSDGIPGWKNSLLIPTLKGSRLLRLKLDSAGQPEAGKTFEYVKGNVRYRDVAVSPDGLKIYLAVDSSSVTSGPSKEDPQHISYRGAILEMKYKTAKKQPARKD